MESPCEPCEQLPTLQRIALQGETAAAVDCHGGAGTDDMKDCQTFPVEMPQRYGHVDFFV